MGAFLCSLHESNIFGARAVFGMDACHIFPQGVLTIIPLIGGVLVLWLPEPALDVGQGLHFALWLSQPCQGQGLLPSCCSRSSQIQF